MNPADSDTAYAFWTAPGDRFTVTYSLAVFHEIDFQVSEGFRRIPHGGVETGGLLFGGFEQSSGRMAIRIEAFRSIECEHAAGPSFKLSDRDVEGIREQIAGSASDPELQGLEILGWFVAHTRTALEMNEREAALFEELFPGPGRILVLAKPERFQATRFALLPRGADGRVDAASTAIILPLPGRAARATHGPAASIPAPLEPDATPAIPPKPTATVGPEAEGRSFWQDAPIQSPLSTPIVSIEAPVNRLPPSEEITQLRSERVREPEFDSVRRTRSTRKMGREVRPSALRLLLLLLVAAGLGCAVGYLAYRQLPSATIALAVRRQATPAGQGNAPGLVVSWPAEETRDAMFASIRVDDGEATPLSSQQKTEGRTWLPVVSDNVKIELIAQRRWRDSRGIVRYVRGKEINP